MNRMSYAIPSRRRKSAGVGIVTAIFLLVVLAGLAVALVSIFTSQQQSSMLDEQGVRAGQAARAGIEWGLYHRVQAKDGACADGSTTAVALAGDVLRQFTLSVSCRKVAGPVTPVPNALDRWVIRATACAPAQNGACPASVNNPDYVRRVIEVQI